jgi:murein DD-endopeptidase MepM/ murein hydrolase activator NlpD
LIDKDLIKMGYLIILFMVIFCNCTSPNEETPVNENKNLQTDIIEGPIASACSDVEYPDWKTSPYVLPYPIGESYKIDLSNCMGYYHGEGKPDQFAIDFNMPIGSVITAARAGEVVWVVENGEDGAHPNNLVVIDHGDL